MTEIMLDLETMDTKPTAAIIAIGAVKFDPDRKLILDRFYSRVDPQSCIDAGLTVSGDTFLWWLKQSPEARAEFAGGKLPPVTLATQGFSAWVERGRAPVGNPKKPNVWGNGATFDNVILANVYSALKTTKPWGYTGDRCYRTVKALFPHIPVRDFGTAHRADHDAEKQAIHLMDIWPHLYPKTA